MKLRVVIWIAVAAAILSPSQARPQEKQDTVFYEVKVKNRFGNAGTRKMYKRGDQFEFLTDAGGLKVRFVKNSEGAFMLHPHRKVAGKYPAGSNRNSAMAFLPGPAGDVKEFLKANKAKKVGTEKVGKVVCDKYSYTESLTKRNCELWVNPKTYVPTKLRLVGKEKISNTDITYVSYQRGVKISDFHFEVPKDYIIRPMPDSDKLRKAAEADDPDEPAADPGKAPEEKKPVPSPGKGSGYNSPAPVKPDGK